MVAWVNDFRVRGRHENERQGLFGSKSRASGEIMGHDPEDYSGRAFSFNALSWFNARRKSSGRGAVNFIRPEE